MGDLDLYFNIVGGIDLDIYMVWVAQATCSSSSSSSSEPELSGNPTLTCKDCQSCRDQLIMCRLIMGLIVLLCYCLMYIKFSVTRHLLLGN